MCWRVIEAIESVTRGRGFVLVEIGQTSHEAAQKGVADFRETLDSDSGESDCRQSAKIFLVSRT